MNDCIWTFRDQPTLLLGRKHLHCISDCEMIRKTIFLSQQKKAETYKKLCSLIQIEYDIKGVHFKILQLYCPAIINRVEHIIIIDQSLSK